MKFELLTLSLPLLLCLSCILLLFYFFDFCAFWPYVYGVFCWALFFTYSACLNHLFLLLCYLLGWGPSGTLSHLHGILSRDAIMAQTCWKPQWNKKSLFSAGPQGQEIWSQEKFFCGAALSCCFKVKKKLDLWILPWLAHPTSTQNS